jgi:CheY-like chemotaxis protein
MGYNFDRLKILVVEDNKHMRKLVITVLQAFGVTQILEADNGSSALEILRDKNPDVVLLDWVMEGMSGIDVVREIRTSPKSPNPFVPVIMLTGHTSVQHVQIARDAGATEFLAKPVSAKAVLTRLTGVIENPRPFVRTKMYFGPCRRRRIETYSGPERREDAMAKAS